MTRAEQAAVEKYPHGTFDGELGDSLRAACAVGYYKAERDLADAFQSEYAKELARADLALTIEDIELLHTFLYAVKNNKQGAFTFTRLSDEQYEEVIRRYEAARKAVTK